MSEPTSPDLSGKRIVVVEDNFLVAADLCNQLRDLGATVLGPAPTTFYAEQLISSKRIDAAILDVRLHGATVYEIADRLRSRGVPILFATAVSREDLPGRFRDAPYLGKPIDFAKLLAKVGEITRFQWRSPEKQAPAAMTGEWTPALMFALTLARQLRRN